MARTRTQALGQHFLADRRVLGRIVEAAEVKSDEVVCEAGAGTGILTAELCRRARRVISFEVDKTLYEKALLLGFENLELYNIDPFKTTRQEIIEFDVFVSNLPYSRSRDAIEWLAARKKFRRAIVMVQDEFAAKLAARQGDTNYRAVSAIASYCFQVERLFGVGKSAFEPSPKVESAVVRLTPVRTLDKSTIKNVNRLFSQRNKKASKVAGRMTKNAGMDFGDRRIDELEPAEAVCIAEMMG